MPVAILSQKGWVVIPAGLRKKYQWQPGDRVNVVDYGGVVSLVPVARNPEEEGVGALRARRRSLVKALHRARKAERQRESARR